MQNYQKVISWKGIFDIRCPYVLPPPVLTASDEVISSGDEVTLDWNL